MQEEVASQDLLEPSPIGRLWPYYVHMGRDVFSGIDTPLIVEQRSRRKG